LLSSWLPWQRGRCSSLINNLGSGVWSVEGTPECIVLLYDKSMTWDDATEALLCVELFFGILCVDLFILEIKPGVVKVFLKTLLLHLIETLVGALLDPVEMLDGEDCLFLFAFFIVIGLFGSNLFLFDEVGVLITLDLEEDVDGSGGGEYSESDDDDEDEDLLTFDEDTDNESRLP